MGHRQVTIKTQITCANAMGNMLPPMVIFKGERFNHD